MNTNTASNTSWRMFEEIANNFKGTGPQKIVNLENFKPGVLRIFRQMILGIKPLEVGQISFDGTGNRMKLDSDFVGIVVGTPKDETKKYQIEYVGYPFEEIQRLKRLEENINRKKT